jgi:hypothetical protein
MRGYDGDRIVLMGASLGTGVAIALAATHEAAALVLEAPYLSALDVASTHYAIFPVSWLMLDQFCSDLVIRDWQPSRSGLGGCLSPRMRMDRRENLERAPLRRQIAQLHEAP